MASPDSSNPQPPWADAPYSIKRHGVTITNCDSEPVQTPGCIQSHGALLVLRPGDLVIVQASENTGERIGLAPEKLLGQPASVALEPEGAERLRSFLASEPVERNPLYVFTMPGPGRGSSLDVCVHTIDGMVVVELEPAFRAESKGEPNYFALVKKSVSRLQTAQTLLSFCQTAAEEVREVTRLDRVMIYRFHPDDHGEVIAESRREDLSSWLGMHYPADDIPKPAREIFKKIWIRPLPNAQSPVMELVPLVNPETGRPLNMTHCSLRGASVMYTEYLENMGVAASLTMPILRDNQLWGLIACHHYSPATFSFQVRAAAEFLAQVVSLQVKAAEEREHLSYRLQVERVHGDLVAEASQEEGLGSLAASVPLLMKGIEAGGVAVCHEGRWHASGKTPERPQLEALKAWLDTREEFQSRTRPLYVTDTLASFYPGGAAIADKASGLLAVSISPGGKSLILWFRPETIQTVNWAGNPHEKTMKAGPHGPRLTPRGSFELFSESVRLRSHPWKMVEIEAALRLRVMIMDLIVARSQRLAELNNELKRSNDELDAFAYVASHDLKEPLRGIYKYAQQLLENPEDGENRKRLEGMMRLTVRMSSLIESLLNFSRVGRVSLEMEETDLNEVAAEALDVLAVRREESKVEIVIPRPLPSARCDHIRAREILVNLISNAIKYNDKPKPRVEIGYLAPDEPGDRPRAPKECLGSVIYYVRDNGIGVQEKHFGQIFRIFKRLHAREDYGGGAGAGLTIVQKLVERHQGRIWLDSRLGEGATFYFTLAPCEEAPL